MYKHNPNMLIPYYLMYSYLYYEKNKSIVTDDEYDMICKRLYDEWNDVEHYHKHLVDRDSLLAGTGYHIQFNERIKGGAMALMRVKKKPKRRKKKIR